MARLKKPPLPDAGPVPERLLRFAEDNWRDDQADERTRAAFTEMRDASRPQMDDAEFAGYLRGIVRYRRRQRWHAARMQWAGEHGMTLRELNHIAYGR